MKIEYKCIICNNNYLNIVDLNKHINYTHKLNRKTYYDKYLKKDNEGLCKICGKILY